MCESCDFATSVTRNAGGQNFVDKVQEYRIHSRHRSWLKDQDFKGNFCVSHATFLGAAAGSPYIVFITRFRRMASGHGYIYIDIPPVQVTVGLVRHQHPSDHCLCQGVHAHSGGI